MQFLYPLFLTALAAISIPIIVHYFNFRTRKTVYFSSIKFLQRVQKESKSKSKLKHFLILLARIAAIICLILAFAQPFTANKNFENDKRIQITAVWLDNSFSMEAEMTEGLTNQSLPESRRLIGKETVTDLLSNTETGPASLTLSQAADLLQNAFIESVGNDTSQYFLNMLFFSDFRTQITNPSNIKLLNNASLKLLAFEPIINSNISIDSVYFDTPGRVINAYENINIQLTNYSKAKQTDVPIKVHLADSLKVSALVSLDPGETKTVVHSFKSTQLGLVKAVASIDDYPIEYDNKLFFSFPVSQKIALGVVKGDPKLSAAEALFSDDSQIEMTVNLQGNISVSELLTNNCILLNETQKLPGGLLTELEKYITNGGTLIFIPNTENKPDELNQLLNLVGANNFAKLDTTTIRVGELNYTNFLYKNVFAEISNQISFPTVKKRFISGTQNLAEIPIVKAENGDKLISCIKHGKGLVYVWNFAANQQSGQFITHSIFVPTLYNMVLYSGSTPDLYYKLNSDKVINISLPKQVAIGAESIFKLKSEITDFEFIPRQWFSGNNYLQISTMSLIEKAGYYSLFQTDNKVATLAFNYNRTESNSDFVSANQLENTLDSLQLKNIEAYKYKNNFSNYKELADATGKTPLWHWFLAALLLFIFIEMALIKWIK